MATPPTPLPPGDYRYSLPVRIVASILLGLAVLFIAWFGYRIVVHSPRSVSSTTYELNSTTPDQPTLALVRVGDRVRLQSAGAGSVIVAASERSLEAALSAARTGDRARQDALIVSGDVFVLPDGTQGTVIDTTLTAVHLDFRDGSYGWVVREAVR